MAGSLIDRRTLLAAGGVAAIGAGGVALGGMFGGAPAPSVISTAPRATAVAAPLDAAAAARMNAILATFMDPATGVLRKTSGGGANFGLVIPDSGSRSIWQAVSLLGVLFDLADSFGDAASRTRYEATYAAIRAEFGLDVLSGRPAAFDAGRPIFTMDDGVWLGLLLQKHHMLTGDPAALAALADLIPAITARFADPDATANPPIAYTAGFAANAHGILYTIPANFNFPTYGKVATTFECMLALLALHVGEHLHRPEYIRYAQHVEREFRALRTPDPAVGAAKFRVSVASRPAKGLLYVQRCLAVRGGTPIDPGATFLGPDVEYYGKPVQGIDATSLGGSAAMALLQVRLYRHTPDPALLAMAVETANAMIDLQGYGRELDGVRSLADTRDPHSDGMWLVPFGREVLTLDGIAPATRAAFVATGERILRTCVVHGLLSADWVGPELNPADGLHTWQQNYDAHPGAQAGFQQIMVNATSMSMVLLGRLLQRAS